MRNRLGTLMTVAGCAFNTAVVAAAEDAASATIPVQPAGVIGEPAGNGRWPAVAESPADLRTHTVYLPEHMPEQALPVLLWGNGACRDNGLQHSFFLREVASHGYFVIALGHARKELELRPAPPPSVEPAPPPPPPGAQGGRAGPDETDVSQMSDAIAWASAQTTQQGNPLFGRIDINRIAVAGHSCGGLQAIKMSADPRISTTMIFNSGVYVTPGGRSGVAVDKQALTQLHGPIAYFSGGPADMAHPNAADDVARIHHVPVFFGWLPVGHGGTFWTARDGGDWSAVAVHWLDWQLKGDAQAGRWFDGQGCELCSEGRWTVEHYVGQ